MFLQTVRGEAWDHSIQGLDVRSLQTRFEVPLVPMQTIDYERLCLESERWKVYKALKIERGRLRSASRHRFRTALREDISSRIKRLKRRWRRLGEKLDEL